MTNRSQQNAGSGRFFYTLVVRRVAQTPGAVGYVTHDAVTDRVRIVLTLEATP